MVDSDTRSIDSESNGGHSCWKWKFRCFAIFPTSSSPVRLRHTSSPDENTSVESLDTPTAESQLADETQQCSEELEKESNDKLRLRISNSGGGRRRSGDNQSSNTTAFLTNPSQSESLSDDNNQSTRNYNNNNNGLFHFLGLHFSKSETRHLDRSVSSQQASQHQQGSDIGSKGPSSRKSTEESRYTKLPLSGSSNAGSTSVQLGKPKASHNPTTSSLFQIQGKKGEKSCKHLKGKSKSDNNLHRVSPATTHLTESASLSSSAFRVGNDYCDRRRLNSVQAGDHATISLPWKQNNLSSVTSHKSHPNTHNNIDTSFHRHPKFCHHSSNHSSQESESSFSSPLERQRSKSLERTSSTRLSDCKGPSNSTFSSNGSSSKTHERFTTRANSIECHPHRRVRRTLNKREQEILLRHIVPEVSQSATPKKLKDLSRPSSLPTEKSQNQTNSPETVTLRKRHVAALKGLVRAGDQVSPSDKFSSSLQHSPRSPVSPTASSPGAFSCPPSPPPRPPSTLKAFRSRLVSPIDKAKAPTPSPTPTPTKTPVSAFPFPPIMSTTRTESPHIPISSQFQGTSRIEQGEGGLPPEVQSSGTTSNGLSMSSVEEARNSGFINQPAKGWLHSDKLLTKEGVTYAVRYIGCHDVNTSMKSLDFETRSLIAKECINQVCEAAGFKAVDRKRKIDRRLVKILGLKPRLEHAGSDVCLTITSTCLKLTSLETGAVIAVHEMPNISFASGGDVTMLDFVAYVAKDTSLGRACFVLECGTGLAQDVITTIGQAFELRFKMYLQKRPPPPPKLANDDPEYYNDLPGKLPPENQLQMVGKTSQNGQRTKPTPSTLTLDPTSDKEMAVNLIDFEAPTPPAFGQLPPEKALESLFLSSGGSPVPQSNDPVVAGDPFDMQSLNGSLGKRRLTTDEQRKELENEPWFHGVVSRGEAEALVVNDGDYLVRESQTTPHQYVLTGLQNGSPKHLLLVDPEGVVRTKDRTFDSVTRLIEHHSQSNRPIISAESIVLLRTPIMRRTP